MNADEITAAEEALEIVFEHLDITGWEDSYVYVGKDPVSVTREPNMYFKQTVSDKKEYLRETLSNVIAEIERLQTTLTESQRTASAAVHDIELVLNGACVCLICANGNCEGNPNCKGKWRGPMDGEGERQ